MDQNNLPSPSPAAPTVPPPPEQAPPPQIKKRQIVWLVFFAMIFLAFLIPGASSWLVLPLVLFGVAGAIKAGVDISKAGLRSKSPIVRVFSVLAAIGIAIVIMIVGFIALIFVAFTAGGAQFG